ncbi:MAG: protein tyrosine phosphatase family protein [Bacteroidetes bacterium]|nr:protein tyrosine phosphatase family protein [Bacteroidota bacterium]
MSDIINFHQVSESLSCSGQPSEAQLQNIANENFSIIINLGLSDQDYSLPNEKFFVEKLNIKYFHIPVLFDNPTIPDFILFFEKMKENENKKVLVHCAANYRASVFAALYLFSIQKIEESEIENFITNIWMPDHNWQMFIDEAIEFIKSNFPYF